MSYLLCILLLASVHITTQNALGQLKWCSTTCLCLAKSGAQMHCFMQHDIYSILDFDKRMVHRLNRVGFDLEKKMNWCNETCLCHKDNGKEFKCTSSSNLKKIIDMVPHLAPYFEPDPQVLTGNIFPNELLPEPMKKKGKKNRKNKKKIKIDTEPDAYSRIQEHRGMFQYAEKSDVENLSKDVKKLHAEVSEHSKDYGMVVQGLNEMWNKVEFNTFLLYICAGSTVVVLIGLLTLTVYVCCKRPKKQKEKIKQDGMQGKVNMAEAW